MKWMIRVVGDHVEVTWLWRVDCVRLSKQRVRRRRKFVGHFVPDKPRATRDIVVLGVVARGVERSRAIGVHTRRVSRRRFDRLRRRFHGRSTSRLVARKRVSVPAVSPTICHFFFNCLRLQIFLFNNDGRIGSSKRALEVWCAFANGIWNALWT